MSRAGEALVAMQLPKMLEGLGRAVAEANRSLLAPAAPAADGGAQPAVAPSQMIINEAEIELQVAITASDSSQVAAGGEIGLSVFSVNASYAKTFSFKEEASSRIKVKLAVRPQQS